MMAAAAFLGRLAHRTNSISLSRHSFGKKCSSGQIEAQASPFSDARHSEGLLIRRRRTVVLSRDCLSQRLR
jgi:hypothetical protein